MVLIVTVDAKGAQLPLLDLNVLMMSLFDSDLLDIAGTRWRDVCHGVVSGGKC